MHFLFYFQKLALFLFNYLKVRSLLFLLPKSECASISTARKRGSERKSALERKGREKRKREKEERKRREKKKREKEERKRREER